MLPCFSYTQLHQGLPCPWMNHAYSVRAQFSVHSPWVTARSSEVASCCAMYLANTASATVLHLWRHPEIHFKDRPCAACFCQVSLPRPEDGPELPRSRLVAAPRCVPPDGT